MARATKKKAVDPMDGARYWDDKSKPEEFMNDPVTGLRGKLTQKPSGTFKVDLTGGVSHAQLPPRSIWKKGEYKSIAFAHGDEEDFNTWVVSGEGTPGNYLTREYVVPDMIATAHEPKHPADWAKNVFDKDKSGGWSTGGSKTKKAPTTKAPALPANIRFRCPGCGHWYREMDLAGHSKVCPKDGEADWAVACECCSSLDDTAKAKKGFPRKVVIPDPPGQNGDAKPKTTKAVSKDGGGTSTA